MRVVEISLLGLDQRRISLRADVLQGGTRHCAVPTPKVLEVRQLGFPAEEIVLNHTVEIVVDEQRSIGNQER